MTVARILEAKGHAVVTVEGTHSLAEASQLLAEHRIGAVLIRAADGGVAGILSERDIVKAIAAHGAAALARKVADHMTQKVITCVPASRINEVMEIMTSGRFRHVPVLKDGQINGMVSIGDVVKHRLAELENESRALRDFITAS